jgi:demethylmenaquinone methyltransferase / 2-methoxy-6-polyprenyl-1,4-benzoquinol methylase
MPEPGSPDAGEVRDMFDRVAGFYDLLNSAMSAGLHHRWRERAADIAGVGPGSRVLDVASGTGDLALELARRVAPGGEVLGSDFSEGMLARARRKAGAYPNLRFEWGDALDLSYADDSFDAATVGFAVRNFSDLGRGLAEMVRVVRPGGRVMVLEFTTPARAPLSWFYRLWFDRIVPQLGRLSADPAAYNYLPESVRRFPAPAALAGELERAGLAEIHWVLTAGGIVTIHSGTVPAKGSGVASGDRAVAVPADGGGAVRGDGA